MRTMKGQPVTREGCGDAVVVTVCGDGAKGERGANEAQRKGYGFADDRITVMHEVIELFHLNP